MNIFKNVATHKYFFFILVYAAIFAWASSSCSEILYYDDFEDGKIDPKYEFKSRKGEWVEKDGVISQTQETPGDHTYLVLNGEFEEPHTALVMIRVDKWGDGPYARCGLGFRLDPGNAAGYAFLITHSLNNMEFLNDQRSWKNNDTEPPFGTVEIGTWYWMKAEISDNGFAGKIWKDGEAEPKDWLLESPLNFGGLRPPSGQVGLNGGSSSRLSQGHTVVSFDNWMICETADECTPDAIPAVQAAGVAGKLPIIWGTIKDRYLDINGDGVVNILDLVKVASNFGETGTNSADVNGDGVVNIQDLVLVANGID